MVPGTTQGGDHVCTVAGHVGCAVAVCRRVACASSAGMSSHEPATAMQTSGAPDGEGAGEATATDVGVLAIPGQVQL